MASKVRKTTMSALKKKRDELDKLSNLPSCVTQQILSKLPIRVAVRTSVLSSNWRHKWAGIPHLVFDDQCVSSNKTPAERARTFQNIVDHVLLLHCDSVDTFKLSSRSFAVGSSCIDKWVLHLWRNSTSIKELVLKIEAGNAYKISSSLFLFPDLTNLELCNCLLKPPAAFKGFPRLKSLQIQDVTVAKDVLEKLTSCCPLIERMSLCGLRSISHLNIDAPNLQFLNVGGDFRLFKIKNSPSLVGIKVTGFCGVKAEVDFLKALLSSPPLQELEISFGQRRKIIRLDDNRMHHPSLLRVLKITGFCGSSKQERNFIRFLLSSTPALERLTLQPASKLVSWELPQMLEGFRHVKKNFMDPSNLSECSTSEESFSSGESSESSSGED